ncbi:MAG: tRNA pseudouridine(13) synthase TruD [Gammaproteobacteria bacterium]|nr:MAG: tRNA pseudouridine(13) synthase TruD [Gammaproteobacteria bacterium]
MSKFDFSILPRVNELATQCAASIRAQAEYFKVDEQLPFTPEGQGGHVWLKIEKRGINTDWLAGELAKFAGVARVAIGYAGLKDRHAITRQWFSINLEGHEEPNWSEFERDDIKIIEQTRHNKKLKRGVLTGNIFTLRLTDMQGEQAAWVSALEHIQKQGVPNYFAEQRFGHNGGNLQRADYWFTTGKAPRQRNQKSMYLSAARSWLFNQVLAERIRLTTWNDVMAGDVMMLSGSKSVFNVDKVDNVLQTRVANKDIHPTGPLWGRGESLAATDCLQVEQATLTDWQGWQQALEKQGLSQERRSLRLFPENFEWTFIDDEQLTLSFFLPLGCYATAVMRELAVITDATHRPPEKREQ